MKFAFIILLLLAAGLVWVLLYRQFKPIGNTITDIVDDIKKTMFDEEE